MAILSNIITPTNLVTADGTQTLTNKTVALGSNSVSGTLTQFNTALTDGDFATLAGSETLTNKTLTAPTMAGAVLNDGYTEEVYTVVDAAGVALSPTNGSIQTWTLGASRTPAQVVLRRKVRGLRGSR